MYKSKNETGYITILYAIGIKPLENWEMEVKNGHIKRLNDIEIQSSALEIIGANTNNNYISCPAGLNTNLGIKMQNIVLLIKNVRIFEFILLEKS
jgi:hypothetical protein